MGFFQALGADNSVDKFQDFQAKQQAISQGEERFEQEKQLKALQIQQEDLKLKDAERKEQARQMPLYVDGLDEQEKTVPNSQWKYIKETFADKFYTDPITKKRAIKVGDYEMIAQSIINSQDMMRKMFQLKVQDHNNKRQEIQDQITALHEKSYNSGEPIDEEKLTKLEKFKQSLDETSRQYAKIDLAMSPDDKTKAQVMTDTTKTEVAQARLDAQIEMFKDKQTWKMEHDKIMDQWRLGNQQMAFENLKARYADLSLRTVQLQNTTSNAEFTHVSEAFKVAEKNLLETARTLKVKPGADGAGDPVAQLSKNFSGTADQAVAIINNSSYIEQKDKDWITMELGLLNQAKRNAYTKFGIKVDVYPPLNDQASWTQLLAPLLQSGNRYGAKMALQRGGATPDAAERGLQVIEYNLKNPQAKPQSQVIQGTKPVQQPSSFTPLTDSILGR